MAGGDTLKFWTKLLQLPGFQVVYAHEDAEQRMLQFTVVPEHPIGVCPHCGKASEQVHQQRTRERIKDLPISQNAVELKVRVPQLWCERCGRAFTPPVDIVAEAAHATERFLQRAAQLIRTGDVANAARFFGVPQKTLEDWYYDYVERQQCQAAQPTQPIRRIGIDELSLKKSTDSSSR